MSMPSSSDAVATSAFRSPARSRDSTRCRRSFDRLPWWAATRSSPSRSPSSCANRSAILRVLTNTSVVRWAWTCSAMRSRISAICSADATAPSSSSGSSSARSSARWCPTSTMAALGEPSWFERSGPAPTSSRAMASMGRCVAESPIRCGRSAATWSRRSRVSARWDPRLFPATAWISSTMTACTPPRIARDRSAVRRR